MCRVRYCTRRLLANLYICEMERIAIIANEVTLLVPAPFYYSWPIY